MATFVSSMNAFCSAKYVVFRKYFWTILNKVQTVESKYQITSNPINYCLVREEKCKVYLYLFHTLDPVISVRVNYFIATTLDTVEYFFAETMHNLSLLQLFATLLVACIRATG